MASTATKLRGTVKNIKRAEGYGFITDSSTGEDYFFHRTAVEMTSAKGFGDLQEDDAVVFTPIDGPKGLRAVEVAAQ